MILSLIVAFGRNREIGLDNKLLWKVPEDMKNFVRLTKGKPIIVGRKTFESFGKPLPGRVHIVITTNRDYQYEHPDVFIVHSIKEALSYCQSLQVQETVVVGGAKIYELMLPYVDRMYLSHIDWQGDADTYFPDFDISQFRETLIEDHPPRDGVVAWKFQVLDRIH